MYEKTDKPDMEVPLCVDLDGTLVRSDTLIESVLQMAREKFPLLFLLPWWLRKGRAGMKDMIARHVTLDAGGLPYQQAFVEYLQAEHARGRKLVLTTAAHRSIASGVATHLGFFDEVLASDGSRNNKGTNKRDELVRLYGRRGFDYAGNSAADLAVWREARKAVIVNPHRGVAARAQEIVSVERLFEDRHPVWRR